MLLFLDGTDKYYSVALIKKNTLRDMYNLGYLQGKKACFAGVGTQAGWNIPIHKVIFSITQNVFLNSINFFVLFFSLFQKVL